MQLPSKKTVFYISILVLCVSFAFFWTRSETLLKLSLQLISFLTLIYIAIQFISRKLNFNKNHKTIIDVVTLTLVTYLIVFSTGNLSSPLFFLIYFLLFGISLLFEPSSSIALSIISTVFFLFTPQKEILAEFLQVASLFLITPLALIFGTQYIQILQNNQKIKVLSIKEDLLKKEVDEQEKEVKIWTEGEFRNQLIKIWESLEALVNNPSCQEVPKQKLAEISKLLSSLLASGKKMEKKIEE